LGFRGEYLAELRDPSRQVIALAEAMPADKYSWRPGPGVRSVSEVSVHIAAGNFLLLELIGIAPPEDLYGRIEASAGERPGVMVKRNQELEKTGTGKESVIGMLKRSLDAVREAFTKTSDADLNRPCKFFGRDATVRAIYLRMLAHLNEHMGQSVAYARVNRVVPPWSQPGADRK
jgi:uncharacterized damage-inducible protein DinB